MIQIRDCIDGMAELEAGSIDVVFTSPPYNLGIQYAGYSDRRARTDYLEWTEQWLRGVKRVLAPQGSFFLNVDANTEDPWLVDDILQRVKCGGWFKQNRIAWVKSMSYDLEARQPVEGHMTTHQSRRFLNHSWEPLYHLTHKGDVVVDRLAVGVEYADPANLKRGTRGKNGNRRCAGDVWHVSYETIGKRDRDRPHPCSFPVELVWRALRFHGVEKVRRVMDPFAGLGSTELACRILSAELERPIEFVGFDVSAEYVALAHERLDTWDAALARVSGGRGNDGTTQARVAGGAG